MERQKPATMTKDEKGVWTAIVGPLEPDIYSYTYEIDGATVTDPRNPDVKVWLQLNSMVEVPGTPPQPWEVQDVPHGALTMVTYRSKALQQTRDLWVYTPPGYASSRSALPVVYLLHGYGDNSGAWSSVGRAHVIADNLLAAGRMKPAVIVMPWGHARSPRRASREEARTNNEDVRRDLLQDVMPLIESGYRVAKDPEKRAIVGLSMGGGQALATGLGALDTFRWVGGFSSAPPEGDLARQFPDLGRRADAKLRLLWIGCGRGDFLLQRNEAFTTWLKARGVTHAYSVTDGAHDWTVWRRYLAEFLPLLFR
jgi:enterochelin esterase family protein